MALEARTVLQAAKKTFPKVSILVQINTDDETVFID